MTAATVRGVTQIARTGYSFLEIPDEPDLDRMRREVSARLQAAMAEQGVDVLVLLGNSNVMYATGISWPLADAGLSHIERPVAVVLAGDTTIAVGRRILGKPANDADLARIEASEQMTLF